MADRMKKTALWRRLLCRFGYHSWVYDSFFYTANRRCHHCDRWEHPAYDMAYGDTYFIEGRYHYE